MVTITKTGRMVDGKTVCEISCLSTDAKPTAGVANGSLCLVIDTGEIHAFNGVNSSWVKIA